MQTPLSQLMDMTRTTAKQISDHTGINVTLLSKFKNAQRPLNYKSKYPALLADYFLNNETEQVTNTIHKFLISRDHTLTDASDQRFKDALCLWLTTDTEAEQLPFYDTSDVTSVFHDVNGLREPLEHFTEYVLSRDPSSLIVIHDFPDGGTFYSSLLDTSLPFLTKMREHGCNIRILDTCRTPKTYMSIHNWMDSYFSDQIRLYTDNRTSGMQRMAFILENELAMIVLGSAAGEKAFLSTFYKSDANIQFFQNSAKSVLMNTTTLIEKIPFANIMEFLQVLDNALTNRGTTFLVNPIMMYKTMNLNILGQVLSENNIPESDHNRAIETNRFTAYLRTKCPYKQIYNLDAMLEIAALDYYVDEEVSELYGKPIKVSKKHLHDHIKFLTQLQAPDYQILFVPFKNMHLLHSSVSYVVQDDGIFLAWDASRSQHRIYSRDTSVVSASYNYMEEIWNSIPAEYTTQEWQNKQIQRLLDLTSK